VTTATVLRVAVAIMTRSDGSVLLAQRLAGTPYAGYWEFPGGKLEPGENALDALGRELSEELGIEVTRATPWLTQRYAYPHADVELAFFRVHAWRGEPFGRDGQAIAWERPGAFSVAPLLPANTIVLRALLLPHVYAISMAEELGEVQFLRRFRAALDGGVRLIQLRENAMDSERVAALAESMLALARQCGARVLVNGDAELARRLGCDGVHWSAARLTTSTARPDDLLCGASCHDAMELARAANLGVDFAVLGPVKATPSHPHAHPLGWERFAELVRATPIPVYALGGLGFGDLATAQACGAHGVALRRAAWSGRDVAGAA
jgi:8-oxo-dGTP diphosphatase